MMAELSNPEKVRSAESSIRTCQLPGVTIWGEHWFSRGIMSDRGEDPRPSSPYRLSPHAKSALYDPRAPAATPSAAEAAAHAPTRRRPRPPAPAPAPPIPRAAPRGVGATPPPPPLPPGLLPPPRPPSPLRCEAEGLGRGAEGAQAGGRTPDSAACCWDCGCGCSSCCCSARVCICRSSGCACLCFCRSGRCSCSVLGLRTKRLFRCTTFVRPRTRGRRRGGLRRRRGKYRRVR